MEEKLITEVCNQFFPGLEINKIETVTSGHIHDTFKVSFLEKSIILQKLNSKIFENPFLIDRNISIITQRCPDITIGMLKSTDGKTLLEYKGYWRAVPFLENVMSYSSVNSTTDAFQVGSLYGTYLKVVNQPIPIQIESPIPEFHSLKKYFEDLNNAIDRSKLELPESKHILKHHDLLNTAENLNSLPTRIVHGDAKVSNVLFIEGVPKYVIDLDTTMSGKVYYDFGDLVRTILPSQDENHNGNFTLQLDLFKPLFKGFLSGSDGLLIDFEKDNLLNGILLIAFEQAIRFLTDHVSDDVYYKTEFRGQNLIRVRNQLHLMELLLKHKNFLEEKIISL